MAGTTPSTPAKRAKLSDGEAFSPRTKERLSFDFWESRKTPKIVVEDLQTVKLSELKPTKVYQAKIRVRCYGIYQSEKIAKIAATDGETNIIITDFDGSKLRGCVRDKTYLLSGFEVKMENPEYSIGSENGVEVICSKTTVIQLDDGGPAVALTYNFLDIGQVKTLTPGTRADILGIVVELYEISTVRGGHRKLDFAITDKSKTTINVTVWNELADFLHNIGGMTGQVVALRQVLLKSYENIKFIETKWWSHVEIAPKTEEASGLLEWFQEVTQE